MTVAIYFARLFAGRFLAALLGLAALLQVLDLLDNAGAVLERGTIVAAFGTYAGLRFPLVVSEVVPLAVLIAALMTFERLARGNEIVALRAAGAAPLRLVLLLAPPALVAGLLHVALDEGLAPTAERRLASWWQATAPPGREETRMVWLRNGAEIVSIGALAPSATEARHLTIVARDGEGRATRRIVADSARWQNGSWMLETVTTLAIGSHGTRLEQRASQPWRGPLPANLREVASKAEKLGMSELRAILEGERAGSAGLPFYATRLQRAYALPLASVIMVMLAAPALHGGRRGHAAGIGLAAGLAAGLSFLVFDGLLAALGEVGILAPAAAAWGPLAIFLCVGAMLLLRFERPWRA